MGDKPVGGKQLTRVWCPGCHMMTGAFEGERHYCPSCHVLMVPDGKPPSGEQTEMARIKLELRDLRIDVAGLAEKMKG